MRLWRRVWDIQIGTLAIRGSWVQESLDASFEVVKDTTRAPNSAVVRVINLSPDHRRRFEAERDLTLKISAGYEDGYGVLFTGDVHVAASRRRRRPSKRLGRLGISVEGIDVITTIEAQDAGRSYSSVDVQAAFGAGTQLIEVLRYVVGEMGVGEGNLTSAALTDTTYIEGTTVSGPAWRELDRLIRTAGCTWSVQDGVLQVLRGGRPLAQTAIRLTPDTGLVGSPSTDVDRTVSATALIQPGLTPGRQVVLDSATVSGSYRIKRVTYRGDTAGDAWHADLTLEAY